ncbi:CU044_2847 family protein [Streptomyces odontomachi]|uniref:CU044_2847 family protein n=1 Tax=Streptomyces odontomachi TaxID=2944940 RepID=UPI00210B7BB5|nr:CU044_2847 family protein [Streptomyces sp. ODS25]
MPAYTELTLNDGAVVRMELASVGEPMEDCAAGGTDLPEEFGREAPVSAAQGRMATLARDTVRTVLSPLGPLLQEVHDSITTIHEPPDEISVQFGVQLGQDLKIGIVGAHGQAALTVSATWRTDRSQG